MPESDLIKNLIDDADNEFLCLLAEIYFALPADSLEAHAAAIANELQKLIEDRANANCPN
jgi:hypothetical protein